MNVLLTLRNWRVPPGVASDNFKEKHMRENLKELHQIVILTWWSCFKILEFFLDCRLLLILQHFHHKIQEVLRYSDAELNVTSHKKGVFFHPKNIRGELRPFFPYLNMRTISITTSGISSLFQDFERWMFRLWSKVRLGYEMRFFSGPSMPI